jgi:hypothetical protein
MECARIENVLKDYKRAINDIKLSLTEIENLEELEDFVDIELEEILNGLDLD